MFTVKEKIQKYGKDSWTPASHPLLPRSNDPEMEYSAGIGPRSWARVQAALPVGCVTFSKSLAHSGPQFFYLLNEE